MANKSKLPYRTRISVPDELRARLVPYLNERLAELIDLQLQVKQAHWNVRGASFIAFHEMLDELAEEVASYADLVAERVAQLGGLADGTLQTVHKASPLDAYPVKPMPFNEHVGLLAEALAKVGDDVRKAIDWSDELGDAGTADLFTEVSRGLDLWTWKVEAHEQ